MARSKLGNDPFQRGAPPREPESSDEGKAGEEQGAKRAAKTPAGGKARTTAPRKATPKRKPPAREAAARTKAPAKAAPAKAVKEEPAQKAAPARSKPAKKAPAPEAKVEATAPAPPIPAAPPSAREVVAGSAAATGAATTMRAVTMSTVITPESDPLPEPEPPPAPEEPAGRPRLRLLRLEKMGALEERLAGTVERLASAPPAAAAADELRRMVAFLAGQLSGAEARRAARGLLSRLGQIVAAADAPPPGDVDAFGRDPDVERRALDFFRFFYQRYFRVEVRGIENVPASGPVLLVANHSGALPWDTAMLKCALAFEHPAARSLRPLTENSVIHFPFLGVLLNRFGAVRACQENAEALLRAGEAVAVFPEGMKGLGKSFRRRYRLQRFGRGGFVRLAMRTRAPVVPVSIIGAEEIHPLLTRIMRPAALLGLPYVPITPTFPWLGPLGLIPLPSKWIIEFGKPVELPESAEDELTIQRHTEDVRSHIQSRIDRLLGERRSVFF